MVIIQAVTMKDFIVKTLENYQGEATFKHLETAGMNMKFECSLNDPSSAALAKSVIKSTKEGSMMYFQVSYHE